MKHERNSAPHTAESGYTITEVMVAITLAVFLLMGLFSVLQQTRNANNETTGLSQLQDDERVAMTILTDTIQQAGYTPTANGSDQGMFTPDGVFANTGQLFMGGAGPVVGDTLTLRYVLATDDTALTCLGTANSAPQPKQVYKEIFEINTFNGQLALACSPSNGVGEQPLVNNVVNLTFQFAVNTTSATSSTPPNAVGPNTEASNNMGNGCPADTYIATITPMSAADWTNVCAVKVDITFINPLYQPAGQPAPTPGQLQYITFERVINVQSKGGVNVTTVTQT
jgi:type IV pilus assembly protein PilW